MGKFKNAKESLPRNDKWSKKKDSSGTMTISDDVQYKYAWILRKQPYVLCEKLPHKFPGISRTFNSHVSSVKLDPVSSNSPQYRSKCLNKSSVSITGSAFCKTESPFQGSKKVLSSKVALKSCSSQSSQKRSKVNILTVHAGSAPSTSRCKHSTENRECLRTNQSVSSSLISTEGSLDEVFPKNKNDFGKFVSLSQGKVKECTHDPQRITPCAEVCCIQLSTQNEFREKKSKKRDKEGSSSKRISKSQPTPRSSVKPKSQSSQKTTDTPRRKKSSNKVVVFIKKENSREESPKASQSTSSGIGFSYYLGPTDSTNLSSQGSRKSESKISQEREHTTATKKISKVKLDSTSFVKPSCDSHSVLSKRIKRHEYFPTLNGGNAFKSETRTSHPKVSVNKHAQNQMLEAATFPKTNSSYNTNIGSSFNKSKLLYTQSNLSYVSPLIYQENEEKISQSVNNYRIESSQKIKENDTCPQTSLSNQTEIQNLHYQEDQNFLMTNSLDLKFVGSTNGFENCEKDRFRNSAVDGNRGNGVGLSEMKINESIRILEADGIQSSTNNDLHLGREGTLLGNQLPYSVYPYKEPSLPLQNIEKKEFMIQNEFPCDVDDEFDMSGVMELLENDINISNSENQLPSISSSQKKNIKIMKFETIPSNCIQILPRSKILHKNEKQSQDESVMNGSFCGPEKVAVINMQNLEHLRKEELPQTQEPTYDYMISEELISNFSLSTTQDENALLNSSILDPNNDLANLNSDGFLEDDIVNNNEKMISNNNGHIDLCNSLDVKEPFQCIEPPALSEVMKLFDPNGRSYIVPVTFESNVPKYDEFINEDKFTGETATTNYIVNKVEEINGVTVNSELNKSFCEFKEPVQNFVNTVNEKVNNNLDVDVCHRKRRWFDEKQKCASEPVKKVKLKRRQWSKSCIDGDDLTDTSSEVSSSCRSSLYDTDHSMFQVNSEMYDLNQSFVPNTNEIKENAISSITEINIESNFQVETQVKKEAVVVEKSQVDPESQPEPEQEESEIQPPLIVVQKDKLSPTHRKKRRRSSTRRSKFQQDCFSSNSSTTSDDEYTKKSSDDELEINEKCGLLKRRFQKELRNVQPEENSVDIENDFKVLDNPISQDDIDDILSVCASPSLMNLTSSRKVCPSPSQGVKKAQAEYSYNNEDYWDTYQRKNKDECAYDLRSFLEKNQAQKKAKIKPKNEEETKPDDLFSKQIVPVTTATTKIEAPSSLNANNGIVEQKPNRTVASRIFIGVCYNYLQTGNCTRNVCPFEHKTPDRLRIFQNQPEERVYNVMRDSISMKFIFYITNIYEVVLKRLSYNVALQVYIDMFNSNLINDVRLADTINILCQKESSFPKVIENVVNPIPARHILLNGVFTIIEKNCPENQYWESVRCLFWKFQFNQYMIEKVLHQCMDDSKNTDRMKEVLNLFTGTNYNQVVNQGLWVGFYNLLQVRLDDNTAKQEHFNSDIDDSVSIANGTIASPDGINRSPSPVDDQDPIDENSENAQNNTNDIDALYTLEPIEGLSPPKTCFKDQQNLWKFYDRLESLKNGLKHEDYSYVVSIIKQYANMDRTLFTRHCHRVLAEEIKKSQIHIDNIVKIAVQSGDLCHLRDILSQLGTSVLIGLADQGLWVYAYELLKTLQNYELHNKNAGFTLLAAEICLANHRLEKALTLLKQNDIIFTNCKRWKVKSNIEDFHLRTSVVTLLLESLCQDYADKAFFIFDLIIGEQASNYYPINLTRIVDKLMLSLLSQDQIDIVMCLCKTAMRYNLNFHEVTYRTVITALVPVDMDLARQFYQYATYLGVYTSIRAYPVTCVIVNVDWSEEEMFLVISEFLRQLFLDVGFTVSHIGTRQLSASFVFESIPTRKQLFDNYPDKSKNKGNKLSQSKAMLKNILQNRFDPPISIVKKEQGKICKINGQSLVTYLKAGHYNT